MPGYGCHELLGLGIYSSLGPVVQLDKCKQRQTCKPKTDA